MAEAWNARAEENARFFIASGASTSEEEFRRSGEDEIPLVLDGLALSPESDVLEIGCGVGRLLLPLASRARTVHGVDISKVMVKKARAYCAGRRNVKPSVTDGTLKGFRGDSLDLVFSYIVFQHIPDRAAIETYVREAGRVLRPGGVFRFQVDGRWRMVESRGAETYDGAKFAGPELRALIDSAGLTLLDEWGEDTHYYWLTARKGAPGPAVRVLPRRWDEQMVADLLESAGVDAAAARAAEVAGGALSLRVALGEPGASVDDAPTYVRDLYRLVLGRPPRPDEEEFHLRVLSQGWDERDSVLDSVLTSKELRDLLQPALLEPPWPRVENVRQALGGDSDDGFAVAARVAEALPEEPEEAVEKAFRLVLGRSADPEGRAHHLATSLAHRQGRDLLARRLLSAPDPAPPPRAPRPDVLKRLAAPAGGAPRAGESFAGEAALGRALLDETRSLDDGAFVEACYRRVLDRAPDADGAAYWAGKLRGGEVSRASFLQSLFWSDEIR